MGLWIAMVLAVIGLAAVASGLLVSRRSSRSLIDERLGITDREAAAHDAALGARKSPLGDALNRALASRGLGADLATQLARADLKITVGEFVAATVILVVVAGGMTYFLRRDIIVAAGACLAGFFAPRFYVGLLRKRRLRAFDDQLADTINLMVNGIRAGYSVLQAMEAVAREMGPPIAGEFERVVQEQQLGLTMEVALSNMLRRVPSADLDMMITAINVQREVGGNLAEVLESISHTIRERIRIKGDIQALTAYGRGAGNLLSAVPVILSVVIYLINPDFISLLFHHPCGWIMLGMAVLGIVVGYIVIRKIVNIEV
jgi:tight adherence protein B